MQNPDDDSQLQTTTANACSMSLDDHIEVAMTALTFFGLGLACETEYHALLVIAEVAKQMHGHAAFDPLPKATILVEQANALIEAERAQNNTTQAVVPDNGKVH